jgi:hypothetical protein
MHFECVSAWSAAEDFSPTEEQEGYGIIGRGRRMLPSNYADPHSTRTAQRERQDARIWRSPAAARDWLADRQQYWPPAYLEEFWIDACASVSLPDIGPDVTSIVEISDRDY